MVASQIIVPWQIFFFSDKHFRQWIYFEKKPVWVLKPEAVTQAFLKLQISRISSHVHSIYESCRRNVFCKEGVLKNFTKFKGKHLCKSLFNKVAGLRPATLIKKRVWHRCFTVNFAKFLGTSFLTEHLRWLLLNLDQGSTRTVILRINCQGF